MKDIDFDELDRAVNSLISPGSTPTAAPNPAPVTPASISSPATPPSVASTTPPLAERRSSGRFMDVVHPSSDMRPVAVPPRPVAPMSSPTLPVPTPEPTKPAESSWPDPIDMHEATTKQSTPPVSEPTPPSAAASDAVAPLESPFLSDAKVEKRPLGAFSNEVHQSAPTSSATPAALPDQKPEQKESTMLTTDDIQKPTDHPIENDTPMPAELQPGLLSIEANEDPKAVPTATEVTGPTSITQQYTEQPSTGDKPTGTVFDTEAYKKPQNNSKKKKSGWLVVLWIFLLLVVGAGIGAAVYFFVLPRL